MLRKYENEIRSVAQRIAEAEREARKIVGAVRGREEKYTEIFRTKLEDKLDRFSEGGVAWRVVTYTTDKQSGQERRLGADLVVAVEITLDGATETKGFLVQAKVNTNVRYGVGVDSYSKLRDQCEQMASHTLEAYVFAYGTQTTKVLSADGVLTGALLSELPTKDISDFFVDVMMCWAGDRNITASTHRDLERLVNKMEGKVGVIISGASFPSEEGYLE